MGTKNKKLSLELRSSQQCLNEHEQKIKEAVELNEQLKEDLHRATKLPRDCHRCADVTTLSASTSKHLQQVESLLEQKTVDLEAKHMEMQRARRAASEDRRRLNTENYQLNNDVCSLLQ